MYIWIFRQESSSLKERRDFKCQALRTWWCDQCLFILWKFVSISLENDKHDEYSILIYKINSLFRKWTFVSIAWCFSNENSASCLACRQLWIK